MRQRLIKIENITITFVVAKITGMKICREP